MVFHVVKEVWRAISGTAAIDRSLAMVDSQYMGTIRTSRSAMKRRQPSAWPTRRRDDTIIMKPLMTKKRSTPELPLSQGLKLGKKLSCKSRVLWKPTTNNAAMARRH